MLESYIKTQLEKKDILLMTHIVIGYPTFETSIKIVETMVAAGVDLIELQIPFSEPIADGPVILHANQKSLKGGATIERCFNFVCKTANSFKTPFLLMSYYNILYKYGVEKFASSMAEMQLKGAIIADLPPEEGDEYVSAMTSAGLDPIFIFSPTTPFERMKYIASFGKGFIYCVARKGVTGKKTRFSQNIQTYLSNCRKATRLPLAVGFGVKNRADIDYLKGKADIAVIGTQIIRLMEQKGVNAIGDFINDLR